MKREFTMEINGLNKVLEIQSLKKSFKGYFPLFKPSHLPFPGACELRRLSGLVISEILLL